MARDITEIYDEIIATKNSRQELSGLNSTSNVSIYKLWAYVVSVAIYTHEVLWDLLQLELDENLNNRINGTPEWYGQKSLEYQDGDELVVDPVTYAAVYQPVIEGNRIITRASFSENLEDGVLKLNLKVAKGDVGALEPITDDELIRFTSYIEEIKFAGTAIDIVSLDANEVNFQNVTVYYDGTRPQDDVKSDIYSSMNQYLIDMPFDGLFYVQKFVDSIQSVESVTDVYIDSDNGGIQIDFSEVKRVKELLAGYAKLSGVSSDIDLQLENSEDIS